MNKICILLSIVAYSFIHGQEVGSQRWIENETRRLQNLKLSSVTVDDLPNKHREDVIEELVKRSEWRLLIRIRDEETIHKFIERYTEKEGRDVVAKKILSESYSPWLLPLLAPLLEEDPAIRHRYYHSEFLEGEDFGYPHAVAEVMGRIIRDSPEFPDDVRAEATKLKGLDPQTDDPWLLAGVRDWWAENGDLVQQERYVDVAPLTMEGRYEINLLETYGLPTPIPEPILKDKQTSALPQEQSSSKDIKPTPTVGPISTYTTKDEADDRPGKFLMLWIILGVASLAILKMVLKVSRKNNKS